MPRQSLIEQHPLAEGAVVVEADTVVCRPSIRRSTTWLAKAPPSFVSSGTKTARIRQPLSVTHVIGPTPASRYQAGPLTTFA